MPKTTTVIAWCSLTPKKIAYFALGPVLSALLGLISVPIVAWYFSADDLGRITMLQISMTLAIMMFSMGLDQAYVREYHEEHNKPALLKLTLLPGTILLFVFCLVLAVWFPFFLSNLLFGIKSALLSFFVIVAIVLSFLTRFLSLIIRMQEQGWIFSISQLLPKMTFLILIGLYVLGNVDKQFINLLLANVIGMTSVVLLLFWRTRHELLMAIKQKIELNKLRDVLQYSYPLIIAGLAFWGLSSIDKVLLRSLSTFEQLGIYSVAVSFAALGTIFQSVFSTVWAPIVYKWAANNQNLEKVDEVTEHVLAFVVFVFCAAGLFSWVVSFFLPPQYNSVKYILVACLSAPLLYTLSETTVVGIGLTKRMSFAMLASVFAFLVCVLAGYLLIPIYGAAGASVATSFAFWLFLVMRTEFSSYVWRPLPRVKLYVCSLACVLISALFALYGEIFGQYMYGLWAIFAVVFGFVFKKSYIYAWSSLKSFLYIKGKGSA